MSSETNFVDQEGLRRLFAPTSVAVIGASATAGKVGHQAVLALADFGGEVFPINPATPSVLGRPAFRSLRDLGRPVDLVLFALPAAACVEAVREAIACGCGGGVILSGGFAESGESGAALQVELVRLCNASTFRLLGPNTAGFVNKTASLTASFVGSASELPEGCVAVIAQSAGVNFTVSFQLEQLGFGVSVAVGLGNAANVGAAEVLEFLAEHTGTKAIALHLEGVPEGRRLYDVIRKVTRTKPIVALTVGKGQVNEFAQSHTGNLLGSYEIRRAALLQAGAVVVDTTDELAAAAAVLSTHRLAPQPRPGVGLLTAQAGPALLTFDKLKSNDISVPELSKGTLQRIAASLPPMTHITNPVDTGRPAPAFGEVLAALLADENIALVACYALHEPAALRPTEVLRFLGEQRLKPVLFATQGPSAAIEPTIAVLRAQGIFVARSPSQLAQAVIVLVQDAAQQERLSRPLVPCVSPRADVPESSDEHAVKQMLQQLGVNVPAGIVARSHGEAYAAMSRLNPPLAVKIVSEEVAHKTDVGGVQLNVLDEVALAKALKRIDDIPITGGRGYLLEEMAPPGLELIVGAIRDHSFGPTVMLGLGGIQAEALNDTTTRLAPLGLNEAGLMLDDLRAAALFDGWRGQPKLDRAAVAQTLALVGELLWSNPEIDELEINPLRVYPKGVMALDARMTRSDQNQGRSHIG
jgi:acetate---CoA ligase (ADP-forming)